MHHTHADLIHQLARDTSLVKLFQETKGTWEIVFTTADNQFNFNPKISYVLTTPDNMNAALHFLNGEKVQTHTVKGWRDYTLKECPLFTKRNWRAKPTRESVLEDDPSFINVITRFDQNAPYSHKDMPIQDYTLLAKAFDLNELFIEVPLQEEIMPS